MPGSRVRVPPQLSGVRRVTTSGYAPSSFSDLAAPDIGAPKTAPVEAVRASMANRAWSSEHPLDSETRLMESPVDETRMRAAARVTAALKTWARLRRSEDRDRVSLPRRQVATPTVYPTCVGQSCVAPKRALGGRFTPFGLYLSFRLGGIVPASLLPAWDGSVV